MKKNKVFGILHIFVGMICFGVLMGGSDVLAYGSAPLTKSVSGFGCDGDHNIGFAVNTVAHFTIPFNASTSAIEKFCLPGKFYSPCGEDGKCGANQNCASVSNPKDTSRFGMMCVNANETVYGELEVSYWKQILEADGSDGSFDKAFQTAAKKVSVSQCSDDTECSPNMECMWVTTVSDRKEGGSALLDERASAMRCFETSRLPEKATMKPMCDRKNAKPPHDGDVCINNLVSPEHFRNVWVEKKYITDDPKCNGVDTEHENPPCGDQKTQFCMQSLTYPQVKKNVCVTRDNVPGGSAAPSSQLCTDSSQCSTDKPYCLTNPETKKNQCFAQEYIYSDMATVQTTATTQDIVAAAAAVKCAASSGAAGTTGCGCTTGDLTGCAPAPNNGNSKCTQYMAKDKAIGFACISTKALSEGSSTIPPTNFTNATVAPERKTRPAPNLEVDIPGLKFSGDVSGDQSAGGRVFSMPYMAQYINAVYRYGIGLGIVFAVVALMYAGIRWMTSLGNAAMVSDAQHMVSNAVLGLILLLSAYTILYVINPDLTKLKSLKILAPKQEVLNAAELGTVAAPGSRTASGTLGSKPTGGPAVSDATCEANKKLPMNPNATPIKDKDGFACLFNHQRKVQDISLVVIHQGGSSAEATVNIWKDHSSGLNYEVGAHYIIEHDGSVHQSLPEGLIGNHTPGGGNGAANDWSIGIDLSPPFNDAQYSALKNLLGDITSRTKAKFDDDHVIGHCEVCGAGHTDPAEPDKFQWGKIGLTQDKHVDSSGTCRKRWHKSGSCPVK